MKKHVRVLLIALACGAALQWAPQPAAAQRIFVAPTLNNMRRPFFFTGVNPLPHFTFSPYTNLLQNLALRNALLNSAALSAVPPPYFGPIYPPPFPPIPYGGGYGTLPAYAGYAAMTSYGSTGSSGSAAEVATSPKPE